MVAATLALAACGGSDDADSGVVAETTIAGATTSTTVVEEQATNGLDDVKNAVVQINTQGSFRDPELGKLTGAGAGSGFIIDESGLAVTNNHVVTGAGVIEVHLADGSTKNAKVLGVSECSDLAVIDIDGEGYPVLEWYEGEIEPGLEVYTAGFPLGDPEYTLTRGIVSKASANGDVPWASVNETIEHDASIQKGNSGGALVTGAGEVVGVNYAGYTPPGGTTEQFFAILGTEAQRIVKELATGVDVNSLGINGTAVNDPEAGISGVWVAGVDSGSPADQAGVEPGDIVLEIEGVALGEDGTMSAYCNVLRSHGADDILSARVLRFDTEQILAGQFNGEPMVEAFSFAEELADDTASGTAYSGYVTVTDETGTITADVPVEWDDVDLTQTLIEGEPVPSIIASTDRDAFFESFDVPGLLFLLGPAGGGGDLEALLDLRGEVVSGGCTFDGRFEYEDPLFTGLYDVWASCGGGDVSYVIVASMSEAGNIALVEVQIVTEADLEALDRLLESFNIVS